MGRLAIFIGPCSVPPMDAPTPPPFSCPDVLSSSDPDPVEVLNPGAVRPVLITCEHAGHAVPEVMGSLGLDTVDLTDHIGWDPGAAALARALSAGLGCTAVLSAYSRLIVDLNRPLAERSSMPVASDGRQVPANQNLTPTERDRRARLLYWPYHQEVEAQLARLAQSGNTPALISVHSFTPEMQTGDARPWEVGVLYASDDRIAKPLLAALAEHNPGDNEPYSGVEYGYAFRVHAHAQGFPHVELELRQDVIADEPGVEKWAKIILNALEPILAEPNLHQIKFY